MAIESVSSSNSAAATQLIEQARQANAKPESGEVRPTGARAEQPREAQPERPEPAQPVVNTQGQVTGRVVNTFA